MALQEKGTREIWNRPRLPNGQSPAGLVLGGFLMVAAAGMGVGSGFNLISDTASATDLVIFWLSAPAALLGIWIFSISVIVLEIRRAAFEAARRAGEVPPVATLTAPHAAVR